MKRLNRKQLFEQIAAAHKLQNDGWAIVTLLQRADWPVGESATLAFDLLGKSGLILAELLDQLSED